MTFPKTIDPRKRSRGAAMVELALCTPLLMLVLFGVADFGRVFHHSIAVSNASRAAAQYAIYSPAYETDFEGMQRVALAELPDPTGATVTAGRYCLCANTANDCSFTCQTQSTKYIQITVRKTFNTLLRYPGIPPTSVLTSRTVIRLE